MALTVKKKEGVQTGGNQDHTGIEAARGKSYGIAGQRGLHDLKARMAKSVEKTRSGKSPSYGGRKRYPGMRRLRGPRRPITERRPSPEEKGLLEWSRPLYTLIRGTSCKGGEGGRRKAADTGTF